MRLGKAQLWGLLVVTSVDPRLGSEKGTDGGELVDVESRQLGGIELTDAEASGGAWKGGDRKWYPFGIQVQSWAEPSTVVFPWWWSVSGESATHFEMTQLQEVRATAEERTVILVLFFDGCAT